MKKIVVDQMDREEFNYCLGNLNLIHNYVVRPLPITMSEEKAVEYYTGVMAQFRDAKVLEHVLRCKFSEKYNIPYAFPYDDGVIEVEEALDKE